MENLSIEYDEYLNAIDYELDLDIHDDEEEAFGHITADNTDELAEYILSFRRSQVVVDSDDDGERQNDEDEDEDFLAARLDEEEDEWAEYTCCSGHGCDYCRCVG